MNHFLHKQVVWFFSGYQFKIQTNWFKKLLYLMLIFKSVNWLWSFDLYFGDTAVVFNRPLTLTTVKDLAFYLYTGQPACKALLFIAGLLVLSFVMLIFKKPYFVADFAIWFLLVNLNNKIYSTLTGGDYLLNQFCLFNCFLRITFLAEQKWFSDLKIFLHNLSVTALIVQVCLLYFLSGLAKCNDAAWLSGEALINLTFIHHFNLNDANPLPPTWNGFFAFLNYLIIFYQISFPLLVWFKKIKKLFILIGLMMHLYIALVMGLFEFGLIMILPYIYFWPFKKAIS